MVHLGNHAFDRKNSVIFVISDLENPRKHTSRKKLFPKKSEDVRKLLVPSSVGRVDTIGIEYRKSIGIFLVSSIGVWVSKIDTENALGKMAMMIN